MDNPFIDGVWTRSKKIVKDIAREELGLVQNNMMS